MLGVLTGLERSAWAWVWCFNGVFNGDGKGVERGRLRYSAADFLPLRLGG